MSFRKCVSWACLALVVAAFGTGQAVAQDANATITGSVADETGQVLPGATITIINEQTKATVRTVVSDARGDFRVPALLPGTYTVKAELSGFRAAERRGNVLSASSTLPIGAVKLNVGLGETMIVEGSGLKVNVEESQHSGLLTATQIEQLQSKGRDVMNLLRVIPGVRYGDDTDAVGDSFGTEVPNVSGQRSHWNRVTVDGLNGNELSGTNRIGSAVNLDAIAEVKVLLNTYKAEFGGTGGANIQIVSKGGGSDYRGSAYYYRRRTNWNANRWENNLQGVERGTYNFDTYGFNIGGPAPLQKGDKKLFFFYSLEAPQIERPGPLRQYMLPTEAERNGDFSKTYPYGNPTGARPNIVDPITGLPFPNNIVPADRINKSMQALMSLYPTPNRLDTSVTRGNYNFVFQNTVRNPRWNHLLRFDWKPTERDSFYIAGRVHKSFQDGSEGTAGSTKWGFFESTYDFADKSITLGHTRIFSSSVINEFSGGVRQADEGFGAHDDDLSRVSRSSVGFDHGQFYPGLNTLGVIPRVTIAGLTSTGVEAANFTFDNRFGETAHDYVASVRDNVTWTKSAHTLKGGFLFERVYNNEARGGLWMGEYDFANSARTANPFATGHSYANMLMGVFNSYNENDTYRSTANRQNRAEWYLQDTWKATRRLTVDLGLRFLWYEPYKQAARTTAGFVPSRYDVNAAPRMYTPAAGNVAVDPANPADRKAPSSAFQGRFVPGSGNVANGMVSASDDSYPSGFRVNQGIHPEPRIGIAYDLFGNGKTAVHFSAGLFHQGYLGGGSQGNLQGPPNFNELAIPNNMMSTFLAGGLLQAPPNVNGLERDAKTPSAYNFSLGVQQDVGWGTVIDVTYVGVLNRHLEMQVNYNYIPDGAKLPGARTVTTPIRSFNNTNPATGTLYPDQFLRPYVGFGDINIRENWGTANYNALQVQLNRRYIKGLQFGVSYTFSKALGVGDEDPARYDPRRPIEQYYTPAVHNQTHNFVTNLTYDFPKASKLIDAAPVRFLLDNWQLSSEYVWASGDWAGIVLAVNPGFDFSGGSNCDFGATGSNNNQGATGCSGGATPVMLKNPRKSGGSPHDPSNPWFDTTAFARPSGVGDLGNTPRRVIQRPPINSLNTSLFKNFPLGSRRRLQLRLEGYNVLNHTQARDINRTATFDAAGNQTNAAFGLAITGNNATRPPRILQASVRFSF
jgi:hypothetical protein